MMTPSERAECLARIRAARLRGDFKQPPSDDFVWRCVKASMAIEDVNVPDSWRPSCV